MPELPVVFDLILSTSGFIIFHIKPTITEGGSDTEFLPKSNFIQGFPGGTSEEIVCHAGDSGDVSSIPWLGRSWNRKYWSSPIQYSCLENLVDRGA